MAKKQTASKPRTRKPKTAPAPVSKQITDDIDWVEAIEDARAESAEDVAWAAPLSKRMTDEQFFNFYLDNFLKPSAPKRQEYFNLHKQTAKLLVDKYNPKTCVDLGGGPGVFMDEMTRLIPNAAAIEKNPFFREWRDSQGLNSELFRTNDMQAGFEGLSVWDMITCIEVMEHMTDTEIGYVLDNIKAQCKLFVFSSTPHKSAQDEEWGHINIKSKEEWKAMFKAYGLQWVEDLHLPTQWTMVFKPVKA